MASRLSAGSTQTAWVWGWVRGEMGASWRSEDRSHLFLRVGHGGPVSGWPLLRSWRPCCLCPCPSTAHPPPRAGLGPRSPGGGLADAGLSARPGLGVPGSTLPPAACGADLAGLPCRSWPGGSPVPGCRGRWAPGRACEGHSSVCGGPGSGWAGARARTKKPAHAHASGTPFPPGVRGSN